MCRFITVLLSISRVSRDWQRTVSRPTMQRLRCSFGRVGCVMVASVCKAASISAAQPRPSGATVHAGFSACMSLLSDEVAKAITWACMSIAKERCTFIRGCSKHECNGISMLMHINGDEHIAHVCLTYIRICVTGVCK